jgi:hypothetical protein
VCPTLSCLKANNHIFHDYLLERSKIKEFKALIDANDHKKLHDDANCDGFKPRKSPVRVDPCTTMIFGSSVPYQAMAHMYGYMAVEPSNLAIFKEDINPFCGGPKDTPSMGESLCRISDPEDYKIWFKHVKTVVFVLDGMDFDFKGLGLKEFSKWKSGCSLSKVDNFIPVINKLKKYLLNGAFLSSVGKKSYTAYEYSYIFKNVKGKEFYLLERHKFTKITKDVLQSASKVEALITEIEKCDKVLEHNDPMWISLI